MIFSILCECTCMESRIQCQMLCFIAVHLGVWDTVSHLMWHSQIQLHWLSRKALNPPSPAFPYWYLSRHGWLLCGSWESNSGLYAFTESAISMEPTIKHCILSVFLCSLTTNALMWMMLVSDLCIQSFTIIISTWFCLWFNTSVLYALILIVSSTKRYMNGCWVTQS